MSDHTMYRSRILEHYRDPHNRGEIDDPDIRGERANPSCGDRTEFFARVEDGKITDARFTGKGCAICTAAASLLTEDVQGRKLDKAEELEFDDMEDLLGVEIEDNREQCATLALEALQRGIDHYSGS